MSDINHKVSELSQELLKERRKSKSIRTLYIHMLNIKIRMSQILTIAKEYYIVYTSKERLR